MATAQYFQEAMQYLEGFRLYCTLMLSHCPQSLSWHGPRVQALSPVSELAMGLLVPHSSRAGVWQSMQGTTTCLLFGLGALAGPLYGSGLPGVHSQLCLLQQAVQLHSHSFVNLSQCYSYKSLGP